MDVGANLRVPQEYNRASMPEDVARYTRRQNGVTVSARYHMASASGSCTKPPGLQAVEASRAIWHLGIPSRSREICVPGNLFKMLSHCATPFA